MINLQIAEFIIRLITFLLAYVISVSVVGAFRAWVAKCVGDTTAQDLGFLTLNPLPHLDPIGLTVLIIFQFGWGRYVPINPFNIDGHWRGIKLAAAYLADSVMHCLLALISLIILLALFDVNILEITQYMVLARDVSHLYIAHTYPTYGSLVITLAFILMALVYLNLVLSMLNFIVNCFSLFMVFLVERSPQYALYNHYLIIIVPILLVWFFAGPLRIVWLNVITYVGYTLAHIFGMA